MSRNTLNKLQLELHVPNFKAVKDYYGILGFKIVSEENNGDETNYLIMERDGTIINFWPGNDNVWEQPYFKNFPKDTKRGFGVEIVYIVNDVTSYYESIKDSVNIVEPLKKQSWGLTDFRLEDPFGYYLRITEGRDIGGFEQ